MQVGLYRKNVMKSLKIKPAKAGFRLISKNNSRTGLAVAVMGLNARTGDLLAILSPYICGLQLTPALKDKSFEAFGEVGYYLTALCRLLKVKMPTATKRSRLMGTRTAALLQFLKLTSDALEVQNELFDGPRTKIVTKEVVLPKLGGKKEMRQVQVIDPEAEKEAQSVRVSELRGLTEAMIDLFWRLCLDIYGTTPASVFDQNVIQMHERFAQAPPPPSPAPKKKSKKPSSKKAK